MSLQRTKLLVRVDTLQYFAEDQIANRRVTSADNPLKQVRLLCLSVSEKSIQTVVSMITGTMTPGPHGIEISSPPDLPSE